MKIRVAIHQPNFFPWLGYFDKMHRADIFILLDNVQFSRGTYINRTRVNTENGPRWLTVPVKFSLSRKDTIHRVMIDPSTTWKKDHLEKLRNYYLNAPFWDETNDLIVRMYAINHSCLCELNIRIIMELKSLFQIKCRVIRASEIESGATSGKRLVELVRGAGGTVYLSGDGSQWYLDETLFRDAGVDLEYTHFTGPVYPQVHGGFKAGLSALDALFNVGLKKLPGLLQGRDGI